MTLSELELERYSRQLVMPGWSDAAQERLRSAHAIVVGAGALGSPVGLYLAAAGVGRIGVVDPDPVELADLHRQPLHFTPDLGIPKAQNAAVKLQVLNPEVQVEPYPARLDAANGEAIVAGADVVVDCSGGFESRSAVNDACCGAGVPFVSGGVQGLTGWVTSVRPGESACLRCAPPADPSGEGAVGAMAGIVGSLQALEALKLLTGVGRPLLDTLLRLDGATMEHTLVPTSRRDECPSCALAAGEQSS